MAKPTWPNKQIEVNKYVADGTWRTTISRVWDQNAAEVPAKDAIEDTATRLTWANAKLWIDRVALILVEAGIGRDEVVAVQLPNSVELHLMRVACEKAGVLCLPILSNMRESEVKYSLAYTDAAAVVIPTVYRNFDYAAMIEKIRPTLPKLRHVFVVGGEALEGCLSITELVKQPIEKRFSPDLLEQRRYQPQDVSFIGLTSGTTGFPKFVEFPAAASGVADDFIDIMSLTSDDVVGAIAPAARGPNTVVYLAAPKAKAKIVMLPWNGAKEALEWIERKRITVACLVPAQLAMMREETEKQRYDLSSVRIWLSAGSLLPPSLAEAVETRMGGVVLSQYGAVDFGVATIPLPEDSFEVRTLTVGKPRCGTRIKIVDDSGQEVNRGDSGEILGRSLYSALGYFKDSKATEAAWNKDGWYATGDLGRVDKEGNLAIVGRKKDLIIRGGQNIYPAEIENLLVNHPKIRRVAVVAMPDPIMGEKACAYIVPAGEELLTMEEMVSFLKEKGIAPFKMPERLEIVDKFPMVSDGQKIDKKALAQDISQKLNAERAKTA
ncbi:MAG: AMP-binding protein [Chloroflexi bacterium]|nr:AMP-binding protein [Chloroflexota bacterium]